MNIRAVPLAYNGTTYRSTLEADWAATFDTLGWYYEYEPWAVDLGDGIRYLADFHLPAQNTWCEVKGGHNQRMHKTRRFRHALSNPDQPGGELVVVLRAAGQPGRSANWHCVTGAYRSITINQCGICEQWCFTQLAVDKQYCRHCHAPEGLIEKHQYISAVHAQSLQQELTRSHPWPRPDRVEELFSAFSGYGRLPFAQAPRRRQAS